MTTQLPVIQEEKAKGKLATKTQDAIYELAYLMTFNLSITHALARSMQDLLDFVCDTMAGVRHHSYRVLVKHGVKVDTVAALRNSPLHMTSLFPDDVISKQRGGRPP